MDAETAVIAANAVAHMEERNMRTTDAQVWRNAGLNPHGPLGRRIIATRITRHVQAIRRRTFDEAMGR